MKITNTIIMILGITIGAVVNSHAHCGTCAMDSHQSNNHNHPEATASESMLAIVPYYLEVQEALAADDLESTKAKATALHTAIHDNGQSDELNIAREAAFAIVSAGNMVDAREAFLTLSNQMIAKTKGLKLTDGPQLYLAYCPMAFDNTGGHWLQKDKTVNNPYFGAQMLRCGMIKETIGLVE